MKIGDKILALRKEKGWRRHMLPKKSESVARLYEDLKGVR